MEDVKNWHFDDILSVIPGPDKSKFEIKLKQYRSKDKNLLKQRIAYMTREEEQQAETLLHSHFEEDRNEFPTCRGT